MTARVVVLAACLVGAAAFARPSGVMAQGAARSYSLPAIRAQCIAFREVKQGTAPSDYRECRVSEAGEVGTVGRQRYHYALYCLMPSEPETRGTCGDSSFAARYHQTRALAIFVQDGASRRARLLFERANAEIGSVSYEKPEIIRNATDTLLILPIAVDGTSAGNNSEYYRRRAGKWQRLEADGWLTDLQKQLPAGLAIWKGVWPDLRTMEAEAALYRPNDANCCPTGGVARVRLAIRAGRLVITSAVIDTIPKSP